MRNDYNFLTLISYEDHNATNSNFFMSTFYIYSFIYSMVGFHY